MFTDKYKPNNFENFVGNSQNISSLQKWLNDWDLQNKTNKICALISGFSGIGKTLCAELLIKKYDLNPTHISPDEKVDKDFFQYSVEPNIQIEKNILSKKNILIIHDIDSYDDHGFMGNILGCIKNSKIPIIAICNNRYDQSLKPILNYCLDIKFQKPFVSDIIKFLTPIIKKECPSASQYQIKKIIEESNCDIRNILLNLQLNYSNLYVVNKKDDAISQTNIFDLTKSFMSQNVEPNEKNALFWLNNDILPLMIHENYPLNTIRTQNEVTYLQNIADGIMSLSDIDLIDKEIKRDASNWELLPYIGWNLIKSVNNCHSKTQIKFTGFLSKISQINKNKNNKIKKNIVPKEPKKSKETKPVKELKKPKETKPVKELKKPKELKPRKIKLIIEE